MNGSETWRPGRLEFYLHLFCERFYTACGVRARPCVATIQTQPNLVMVSWNSRRMSAISDQARICLGRYRLPTFLRTFPTAYCSGGSKAHSAPFK
jgi:hypothetical protein